MDRNVRIPELGQHMGYSPSPPLAWFERIWMELGLDVGLIRQRDEPAKNVREEKLIECYERDMKIGNEPVKSELHRAQSCPGEPITSKQTKKEEARHAHHSF
ncbi:hypothetical protein AAVH_28887 [Aphelenchoides avenae]|nr:hypothetical protein AAVH_28887 [Aphelenchus avenae]